MAKFCGNCGNPVDQGAMFCDNCGTRLDSFSGEAPTQQQFQQQPIQQMHYNDENTYPQTPEESQKKKKPLSLIIGGVAVLLVIVIVIIAVSGKSGNKHDEIDPVESFEEIVIDTSTTEAQPTEQITIEDNRTDFEKYGMVTNIKKNETFDIVAKIKGTDETIIGKAKLKSFTRESVSKEIVSFMSDNGADVSGYERLKVSFVVEFPKSMLNTSSMTLNGDFTRIVTDYYDIDLYTDTSKTLKDTEGETYYSREINANGNKKKIYFWLDSSANLDGDTICYNDDRTFLVPKGYDGVVCGYRDVHLTEQRIYKDYDKDKYDLFRLISGDNEKNSATEKSDSGEKDTLPYSNLGKPRAEDFAWIADAQSGSLVGNFLGKNEFIGKWKAEIILDGVFKLANITIEKNGTVTITPYKLNTGNGWKDDPDGKQTLKGEFDYGGAGNVFAIGDYGNLDLYQFVESNGTQYGIGTLSLPSGENVYVYLVRK